MLRSRSSRRKLGVSASSPAADLQRFESLYRRHYAAVLRYAARRADVATAEDVAAETFAAAWRRLDRVPEGERALAWLYIVARHELSTSRRGSASERDKVDGAGRLLDVAGRDPADALAERDVVLRAFTTLSEPDREILRLAAWEGLSPAIGARMCGTSRAAYAMRLSRARRRLAAALTSLERTPSASPTHHPTTEPLP